MNSQKKEILRILQERRKFKSESDISMQSGEHDLVMLSVASPKKQQKLTKPHQYALQHNLPHGSAQKKASHAVEARGMQPPPRTAANARTAANSRFAEINKLWIHCNVCFEILIKRRRVLYLLSCYHVLCSNCLLPVRTTPTKRAAAVSNCCECKVCHRNVQTHPIGNEMPNHLKFLFNPTYWLDKKCFTLQIYQFQNIQRTHLVNRFLYVHARYRKYAEAIQKVTRRLKERRAEKHQLEKALSNNKQKIKLIKRQQAMARKREEQRKLDQFRKIDTTFEDLNFDLNFGQKNAANFRRTRGAYRGRSPAQLPRHPQMYEQSQSFAFPFYEVDFTL